MSKFPEKIWTMSWDDERYIIEYFLKCSDEDCSATYGKIDDEEDDYHFIDRGKIIVKDDDEPNDYQEYWEDYNFLKKKVQSFGVWDEFLYQ